MYSMSLTHGTTTSVVPSFGGCPRENEHGTANAVVPCKLLWIGYGTAIRVVPFRWQCIF